MMIFHIINHALSILTMNSSQYRCSFLCGMKMIKQKVLILLFIALVCLPVVSFASLDASQIPAYNGEPYIAINNNIPSFSVEELAIGEFEEYSPLDSFGRCGVACAVVSVDTMPSDDRSPIGMIKPTGWHTVRYDGLIDGNYLYNRCHLIGYQLTGQNANECNLITGTRYMNTEGMLPIENYVAYYVEKTGNSVLYRVAPLFSGDNLLAQGVQIEAVSIEDGGAGVMFNVFCYNVQPGIAIDYVTGDSRYE